MNNWFVCIWINHQSSSSSSSSSVCRCRAIGRVSFVFIHSCRFVVNRTQTHSHRTFVYLLCATNAYTTQHRTRALREKNINESILIPCKVRMKRINERKRRSCIYSFVRSPAHPIARAFVRWVNNNKNSTIIYAICMQTRCRQHYPPDTSMSQAQ